MANQAKELAEKSEISERLKFAVNNIIIEKEKDKNELRYYFTTKETFVKYGKFDTNTYNIHSYELTNSEAILYISKGNGNKYKYTIDLETGQISSEDIKKVENHITYNLNGGNFNTEQEVIETYIENTVVAFPIPNKEGSEFEGWYLNSDFSGDRIDRTTKDMTGDISLYAKWIEETDQSYFTYSSTGETITGLSEKGQTVYNNGELINLVLPKKHNNIEITTIGSGAFKGLDKLEKIVINNNITTSKDIEFKGCKNIKELTIPISLRMSTNSFAGCTGITKVTFTKGTGEGADYISGSKYQYTPWYISKTNTINVTLEEGITKIGSSMFKNCIGLQIVKLPSTLTSIGNEAFYNCSGMKGELNSIENLTYLGQYAFCGCSGITGTIKIPNAITELNSNIFNGTSIEKLIIHDNVTTSRDVEFKGCKNLKELTIPISLSMSTNSFAGCTGITKVTFTKGTGECANYISGSKYQYTPWYISKTNNINVTFEEGITKIGSSMFYNCTGLQMVRLPSTLISIENNAFYNCSGMKGELNSIENLTYLGEYAFYGCSGITGTIKIPSAITELSAGIFYGTSIEKLVIHNNVTTLKGLVFYNCANLRELTIPISLSMSTNSFAGCTGITKVTFTKGTGEGADYTNGSRYQYTPWYISKNNKISFILDKDIKSIGASTFRNLSNASFYYRGSEAEWSNVVVNSNNTITIKEYNYSN